MTEHLTVREYALRWKLNESTVRRYIAEGLVPIVRLGTGGKRSPIRIVVSEDHQPERGE